MRPSVHITTPPPSFESMVKLLRIPKARQKELRAMMDEARARLAAEQETHSIGSVLPGDKTESACPAR